jgi:hypothetical protein
MEGQNMKTKITFGILLLFISVNWCQGAADSVKFSQVDRFRFHFDISTSLTSFKLFGTADKGPGTSAVIDQYIVEEYPLYKYTEERIYGFNVCLHIGLNIPFYRTKTWSTGIKTNLGLGYQNGIKAEDFSSFIIDLPQYVYYRNYKKDFDYSVFAGYKYTIAPIPYGLVVIGFDYNLTNRSAIRFYISPIRRTYYAQLTNGDIKPAIRVIEFGIGFIF